MEDLYKTLGVSPDASKDDIRKAYRRLARQFHPDVNPDPASAEKFKAITRAYNILSDPEQRRRYDQTGSTSPGAGFADFDLGDLFQSFFGGGGGRSGEYGQDHLVQIEIDLYTVVHGGQEVIKVPSLVTCEKCHGSRSEPGHQPTVCLACSGQGFIRGEVRTPLGNLATKNACSKCRSTGERIDYPCSACSGQGRYRGLRDITVDIPKGIESGMRIKIPGAGDAGRDGNGDLYVEVKVKEDPYFVRDGIDLYCQLDISLVDALLGATVKIEGLDGEVEVIVPPLSQNKDIISVPDAGARTLRSARGKLQVVLQVILMHKLDAKQEELLRKLMPKPQAPKLAKRSLGFFSWLKDKLSA